MFLRRMRSDVEGQRNAPSMCVSESRATNPAAADAATGVGVCLKKSVIIGDAFPRIPMPAVTLKHSTTHRHQNCGVLMALAAETLTAETTFPWSIGGSHPPAGTLTSTIPSDMNTA